MASYKVAFKSSIEKDLKKIDRQQIPRIISAVESLTQNPFPPSSKRLVGSDQTYRLRIGDYRVIYTVSKKMREIEIQRIRHRKEVYR